MRNYSDKQKKFAIYLCEHFGMSDNDFISKFLTYYLMQYGFYQKYQSGWYYNSSPAISELIQECDLRKKRDHTKIKNAKTDYIRATDIANYTFCPASFSINNTFEIEYRSGEKEREAGEKLHNQLKLILRVCNYNETGEIEHELFDDPDIIKILKSKNVYLGHNDSNKSFFNTKLKIASEPDYIFIDQDSEYFIVEEKFQYKRDPNKSSFVDNWLEWNGYYPDFLEDDKNQEIDNWKNFKPHPQ